MSIACRISIATRVTSLYLQSVNKSPHNKINSLNCVNCANCVRSDIDLRTIKRHTVIVIKYYITSGIPELPGNYRPLCRNLLF